MSGPRRAWHGPLAAAGVVAAVVALTGGMAWLGHRTTTTAPRPPGPPPTRTVEITLAYVGSTPIGPRLFTEVHTLPAPHEPALKAAVDALMNGSPHDDDYRNYLLASRTTAAVREQDGVVTVSFHRPPARLPDERGATARMVLQAIVRTVDLAVGSDVPVRFEVAGRPTATVLGVDTRDPVRAAPAAEVDSPVQIEAPGEAAFVTSGAVVRGRASTADGRVYWAVYRTSGLVLVGRGRSAAARCCTFTPYSFRLPRLTRGETYLLAVGSGPDLGGSTVVDTKQFSVR